MYITQAISIFKASKGLATILLASGPKQPLYPDEATILIELQKVVDAGFTNESWIYKMAGLDYLEFNALLSRLAYHHKRGEDVPETATKYPLALT
ncbi:MAG: hypothetical protein JWP00_549 [Chloroflexi bacterium]|jgi:tRNA pseudouridine-54 N-methylase|nr:hypothetical protein [Chloroflexota bacterium]